MKSCGTDQGIYLVIWFKGTNYNQPIKFNSEEDLFEAIANNIPLLLNIDTKIINCHKRISPSKEK